MTAPARNDAASADLVDWAVQAEDTAETPFDAASRLMKRLGAHVTGDGTATFGFWAPALRRHGISPDRAVLEILTPPLNLDLTSPPPRASFRRDTVTLNAGPLDTLWVACENVRAGTADTAGVFYQVRIPTETGTWLVVPDYLAASVPFGAFAPAELYDLDRMQSQRADAAYFETLDTGRTRNGRLHGAPPNHILQIHPGTSSDAGSLAGLTRIFREAARKIEENELLKPQGPCPGPTNRRARFRRARTVCQLASGCTFLGVQQIGANGRLPVAFNQSLSTSRFQLVADASLSTQVCRRKFVTVYAMRYITLYVYMSGTHASDALA